MFAVTKIVSFKWKNHKFGLDLGVDSLRDVTCYDRHIASIHETLLHVM